MPIQKPYAGTSVDRVVGLMNLDNQSSYVLGTDFNIIKITTGSAVAGTNTTLQYESLVDGRVSGVVYYTRLPLSVLQSRTDLDKVDVDSFPTSIHALLPRINAALGLDLATDEVIDTQITSPQLKYRLTITENNPAWLPGSYYDFETTLQNVIQTETGFVFETETGLPFELETN